MPGRHGHPPLALRGLLGVDPIRQLGKSTGHVRRLILEGICHSKKRKEKERGGLPFALMQERHIREVRDEKAEFREAANSRLKSLRQLFTWAKSASHVTTNPPLEVERLSSASEGFHTWTDDEVARFEALHRLGPRRGSRSRCSATPASVARTWLR